MSKGAFIGDLAKRVGMTVKTIRYYEEMGLLSQPERTESGYRRYTDVDAERLRFIKGAKLLGLSLGDIRDILEVWSTGTAPCSHVAGLLEEKLAELDRRIERLTAFRDELKAYKRRADDMERAPDSPCKHIDGVARGSWQPPEMEPAPPWVWWGGLS